MIHVAGFLARIPRRIEMVQIEAMGQLVCDRYSIRELVPFIDAQIDLNAVVTINAGSSPALFPMPIWIGHACELTTCAWKSRVDAKVSCPVRKICCNEVHFVGQPSGTATCLEPGARIEVNPVIKYEVDLAVRRVSLPWLWVG